MRALTTLTDKELISLLKEGDKYAFETLYNQYKYPLTANLLKLLKSEELTAEVLQELFIKIWDRRTDIDIEKSFSAYLFHIAHHMVIDIYRKASRDSKMRQQLISVSKELYTHIEEKIFDKEIHTQLQAAISLLPPQRKKVFTLCRIEGKSYKEISQELGISISTINDHLLKANKFLKEHLNSSEIFALSIAITSILHNCKPS